MSLATFSPSSRTCKVVHQPNDVVDDQSPGDTGELRKCSRAPASYALLLRGFERPSPCREETLAMRRSMVKPPSWFDDCRHLLRHLHDPIGLSRNPIVCAYLVAGPPHHRAPHDAMLAAQSAVRAAVKALENRGCEPGPAAAHYARQAAIIRRCDLGNEPKATVARDPRAIAKATTFVSVAKHVASWPTSLRDRFTEPGPGGATIYDPIKSEFSRIEALFHAGEVSRAVTRLERFISNVPDRPTRLIGYCTLVGFLAYVGRLSEARLALQAATECYSAIVGDERSTSATLADCRIRYLVARSSFGAGTAIRSSRDDLDEAIAAYDERRVWSDRSLSEVLIAASAQHVHFSLILGDVDGAERAVSFSERMSQNVIDPTVVERCDYIGARAGLYLHKGMLREAIETLRSGLELTRGGPFPHQMANLFIGLSRAFEFGGDRVSALAILGGGARWSRGPMDGAGSHPAHAARIRFASLDGGERRESSSRRRDTRARPRLVPWRSRLS